jgi:hypothetical protein
MAESKYRHKSHNASVLLYLKNYMLLDDPKSNIYWVRPMSLAQLVMAIERPGEKGQSLHAADRTQTSDAAHEDQAVGSQNHLFLAVCAHARNRNWLIRESL